MKIFRSTLVAVVATVVAACGDKVNVQAPVNTTTTVTSTATATATATPKVNSVTVTPATATLTVGQTITMTAAVSADAGLATTVTWSSSDATLATVSTAGVVTAVKATPGVSICATSTVDTGKKGCGAVVVTAASATVPATASIAGVFTGSLTTPVTPTNVTGTIFAQVNISTGTQVVQRVVLIVGGVRADSQVFSAAQSAALRYAADQAGVSKDVAQPTVVLSANTKAYGATFAPTWVNASGVAVKAELWVAGATTASSTASFASSLTLANADTLLASWTLPSTVKTATDNLGYQWTGFGGVAATATLKVTPILYSGKTLASGTAKVTTVGNNNGLYCDANTTSTGCTVLPTGADTATVKTATASGGVLNFVYGLFNNEYDITVTPGTPVTPTVSLVYSDGSGSADASLTQSVAMRIDNKGPARPTIASPQYMTSNKTAIASTASFQGKAILGAVRPATLLTLADSAALITMTVDAGVSRNATAAALQGTTFKAYRNVGGVVSTGADTLQTTFVEITGGANLTAGGATAEAGKYCLKAVEVDALGNASLNFKDGQVITKGSIVGVGCQRASTAGSGIVFSFIDNTAPVIAFASTGNYSAVDTAVMNVGTVGANYYYSLTDSSAVTHTPSLTLNTYSTGAKVATCPITGTTTCSWTPVAAVGGLYNVTDGTTAMSGLTITAGQYIVSVAAVDGAGNVGTSITRVFVSDNVIPGLPSTPSITTTTLVSSLSIASFGADNVSLNKSAAYMASGSGNATAWQIFPADFSTTSLDASVTSSAFTKFLAVGVTQTVAAADAPAYFFGSDDLNSNFGQTTNPGLYKPKWGIEFADQVGLLNSATAASGMLYADSLVATLGTSSSYAGVTGGLDGYGTTAATIFSTNTLSSVALAGSSASATGGKTLTTLFSQQFQFGKYVNRNARRWLTSTTPYVSTVLCSESRVAASAYQYQADGTELTTPFATNQTDGVISYYQIPTTSAPSAAYVYALVHPTLNIYVKVGTATQVSTITAGTGCNAKTTNTYQFTWTPGAQRVIHPFVSGTTVLRMGFVLAKGHMIMGPATPTVTYTP